MAESTSISHRRWMSLWYKHPAIWMAAHSQDIFLMMTLFNSQPLLANCKTSTTAVSRDCSPSDQKTKLTPFSCMFVGVGAFSWPVRVALNNYAFMRLISLFKPSFVPVSRLLSQLEGVLGDKTLSIHKKYFGPSSANVEYYSSDLWNDNEYDDKEDECDEDLFLCGKHIQEGDSDEGEIDSEEEEESCVDGDIIQFTDLCLEENGSRLACSVFGEDDDEDDFIVFSECPEVVVTKPACSMANNEAPSQVHSLLHTSSYSSDESGYYENMMTDSSGDESEDDEGSVLDEGLWQELEEQAHFFVGTKPLCKPTTPVCKPAMPIHKPATLGLITDNKSTLTDQFHQASATTGPLVLTADCITHTTEDATAVPALDLHCTLPPHKTRKSVSFKPESELVQVHLMVTWQFAYRACRRGPWEQIARDRDRFRTRIENTAKILNPCLKKHSVQVLNKTKIT